MEVYVYENPTCFSRWSASGIKNGVVYQNGKPICETFTKHGGRTNSKPIPEREKEKE